MPEETTGPSGPPAFPGSAPPVPPPPVPPPAVPPPAPPAYPTAAAGGYSAPRWQDPGATAGPPENAALATWGTRLGGYLIDVVIFIPVLVVLAILFRHTHVMEVHFMARRGTARRSFSLLSFFIDAVLFLGYATVMVGGRRGQTVGMMAVGVRAVRDGTGEMVGYGRAFGRALAEQVLRLLGLLSIILGVIWLLDMLFPLWDKKRQTLHDKVAQTVVLRLRHTG